MACFAREGGARGVGNLRKQLQVLSLTPISLSSSDSGGEEVATI